MSSRKTTEERDNPGKSEHGELLSAAKASGELPPAGADPDDGDAYDGDSGDGSDEEWFRRHFGDANVWLLSPGIGAGFWTEFQAQGIAAIDYSEFGADQDLRAYDSLEEIRERYERLGFGRRPNDSRALWEFAHVMRPGDYLIAKKGRKEVVGWGRVTGEYGHEPEGRGIGCRHVRSALWNACDPPAELPPMSVKTLTRVTDYKAWLRLEIGCRDPAWPRISRSYGISDALQDLFLGEPEFRRILTAFRSRKNVILQGPPGVGKTFIARRIAYCLLGKKAPEHVEFVQFHQSYAYEDFVQGWRPTEQGGFELRNGVFFDFCQRALAAPDEEFVFVIDEVNRGNLSRIFGELLMLIEADKRGRDHAVRLTYGRAGDKPFFVPKNVFVLGLMNTADRSLALVDYALRRRFAFFGLRPEFNEAFGRWLENGGVSRDLVQAIRERMTELNEAIRNDSDLGPGFEVGHSYLVPPSGEGRLRGEEAVNDWYRAAVETQLLPLLREYWFDRPERVSEWGKKLLP